MHASFFVCILSLEILVRTILGPISSLGRSVRPSVKYVDDEGHAFFQIFIPNRPYEI